MSAEQSTISLPAWRRYLAYITVALMPLSANIEKYVKQEKPHPDYKGPLDVLLPLLFLLLLIDWFTHRDRLRFKCPPIVMVVWAILAAISCVWIDNFPQGGTLGPAVQAVGNVLLYGMVGVWAFQNIASDPAEYRKLALILGASFSVCLLLAAKQYFGPVGIPYDPDKPNQALGGATNMRVAGWYDFRAAFGSHVALLAPAAAAFALTDRNSAVRAISGAFVILALCVTLSAGGFIGACAGIVAVACAYGLSGRWLTALTGLAILLGIFSVALPNLPRKNSEVLLKNVSLFDVDDKGNPKTTARLRRYQAALELLGAPTSRADNARPFWTRGVGIGRYQSQIGRFYNPPRPPMRTDDEAAFDTDADERFTFGFLETIAVELGVPGLIVIAFVFGVWIFSAAAGFLSQNSDQTESQLALAALGAGVGALALSIFASPMIPGVKGTFAFFIAVALCSYCWSRRTSE